MNRVLKSADARPYFGADSPRFLDPGDAAMLEAAVAAARAEGFAAGRRAGRDEAESAAARIDQALWTALERIRALRDESLIEAVELGCAVADIALGEERFLSDETLARRIRDAIASLDDPEVTIHLAPADLEPQRELLTTGTTVRSDPSLREGEARLTGAWASVEITKDSALAVAREVLT